ncbi:YkgJ family cysteine cluster protein [Desulfamplus magnetovallimortis]|nr:YkgJ family cysteine cluster protein [Desulfamplus magnetovallimortis]
MAICNTSKKESSSRIISSKGFSFYFNSEACRDCHALCCRGKSGNIWINREEMINISSLLNLNPIDAMQNFFEKRDNRLLIREQFDGKEFRCLFLDNNQKCSIYKARPAQCRSFPFWAHYSIDNVTDNRISLLVEECPGVVLINEA